MFVICMVWVTDVSKASLSKTNICCVLRHSVVLCVRKPGNHTAHEPKLQGLGSLPQLEL